MGLTPNHSYLWWALVLVLAVGGGIGFILLRNSKVPEPANQDNDVSQLSLINRVTSLREKEQEDLDLIGVLSDLRGGVLERVHAHLNTRIDPALELTKLERQALAFFILGYSTKQVAVLLNRSVGYIDNSRTILRKKLGLQKSMAFENWPAQSQKP